MDIATNLKKYRSEAKLSKQEVAERINVKPNTYASWEAGKTTPSALYMIPLCNILGVGLEKLYENTASCVIKEQKNSHNTIVNNAHEIKMDVNELFQSTLKSYEELIKSQKIIIDFQQQRINTLEELLHKKTE